MQQVADRLGIARTTYSGYESNYREPDAETLAKLAEQYEVTTDFLLTGHDPASTDDVSREEREFLKWVDENLESSFFYDFDRSPEDSKREMMETLRFIWEREKKRLKRDKQGE